MPTNLSGGDSSHYVVAVAREEEAAELTALLRACYAKSSDFTIHNDAYFDAHFTPASAVLTVRENGELLATMKASILHNAAGLNGEDEGSLTHHLLPTLLLSRGATIAGTRARGLNSVMRLLCIEAGQALEMKSLTGTVFGGASRTKLMREIGYTFTPIYSREDRTHTYLTECFFAALSVEASGASAIKILRLREAGTLANVRWSGPSLAASLRAPNVDGTPVPATPKTTA